MAEITKPEASQKKAGVKRLSKRTTRVDLTPMVDLGFLLITFFIFTTSMSEPKVTKLILPNDDGLTQDMPVKESATLTLIIGDQNKVTYYEGQFNQEGKNLKYADEEDIRSIIHDKKLKTPKKDLFIIIKATNNANYGNIINLLDEMVINDVGSYAFVDLTNEERSIVAN